MAAVALVLTACGTSADETAVDELITRHYADPAYADLTVDGRTAFGHPVEDAACAEDLGTQEPEDVEVCDVEVEGDEGTAVADGYEFTVVKVDGTWLIDG